LKKLAIITSHPIQYNAPLFQLLHKRNNICIKVFYTWGEEVLKNKFDPGFGKTIEWDIPLLQGYDYCFVKNRAKNKGSHHYKGIDNPTLISEMVAWDPDAILVYGWSFKSHLKALRYFHKRRPVFFRGDSISIEQKNIIKKKLRRLLLKWVYKHVDKGLYVGTLNKNYFLDAGMNMNQLVFAPHAVDNDRFHANEKAYLLAAEKWKHELNIDPNQHGFLYAGKLDDNKNTELLIDAFIQIQQEDT
jgi:glycosyltransferase involved in cell wall biosynthesis